MIRPYSVQSRQHVRMSVPNNSQWPAIKKLQQNIIKFPYSSYPFPNQQVNADLFNTIVQCNINEQKIDKIVNFRCQNIISLKKIVKIKMKDRKSLQSNNSERGKGTVSTYSFYYEKVEYSLGHVLQLRKKEHVSGVNKFNLDRAQIKKTLASVIAALYKQGIITFLQFSQIGVNEKGVIKIYIAPNVLFDQRQYNPKTKILVITYLNTVLKQIDAKFPKSLKSKNSLESFRFKADISIEKDIMESQQSFIIDQDGDQHNRREKNQQYKRDKRKDLFGNEEKSINEQEENFIGASGSTNLEHLKLEKEIKKKFENHKLASKAEQNIQNQKKSKLLTKVQQKKKIDELSFKLEQIRKKVREKVEQKRQKYIYASKAFRTMATEDRTQVRQPQSPQKHYYQNVFNQQQAQPNVFRPENKNALNKKRKSSASAINFYHGLIPNQKNINCINIYNPRRCPQKSLYHNAADDALSVDTYELQIGDDYEMPKMSVPMGMRNSMIPQKARQSIHVTPNAKSGQKNPSNPRFSESAGGKSYGHIVNLLKPQFQPKKSNIYEQPENENQQDSRKSISLKKSTGKQPSQISSIAKNQQNIKKSPRILSSSVHINNEVKGLKTVQQFKNDLRRLMSYKISTQSPEKPSTPRKHQFETRQTLPITHQYQGNPEVDLMYLRETEYKPKTNQKKSDILVKKSALQEKVRKAMERTKKAINVMQTAKIRQSGSVNWLKGVPFQ